MLRDLRPLRLAWWAALFGAGSSIAIWRALEGDGVSLLLALTLVAPAIWAGRAFDDLT